MAEATQGRRELTNRINHLEFAEYRRAGWFKAVTLDELTSIGEAEREFIRRWERASEAQLDWEMIRIFLQKWLIWHHPESIGAYSLEVAEFRSITRDIAFAAVDRIIGASLEHPDVTIRSHLDRFEPANPEAPEDVPYQQLAVWFAELFGDTHCRFYLHDSAGGPTVRFDVANPRVIGCASDLVGMLWLE